MRVVAYIPLWRRPEIYSICIDGYKRNKSFLADMGITLDLCVVLSPEDPHYIELKEITPDDAIIVECKNQPLGFKKSEGLEQLLKHEWDYILELNSDDIASNLLFHLYLPLFKKKVLFFGLQDYWIFDSIEKKLFKFNGYDCGTVIGGGRVIHRSLCGRIWRHDIRMGMDSHSEEYIWRKHKLKPTPVPSGGNPLLVDIKSYTNIHTMYGIRRIKTKGLEEASIRELEGFFPPEQISLLGQ